MDVLAKYGCIRSTKEVVVRVRVPGDCLWSEHVTVTLEDEVTTPVSFNGLRCGGNYALAPDRGVTEKGRAELEERGDWERFCVEQDEQARLHVPASLDTFFFDVVRERRAFKADYTRIGLWPGDFRQKEGRFPSWNEIAKEFPATGVELRTFFQAASPAISTQRTEHAEDQTAVA
jgi:hypothetical protein